MRKAIPLTTAMQCIGVANFLGAPKAGPEQGPDALRSAGLVAVLQRNGLQADWRVTLAPGAGERMQALYQLLLDVADAGEAVVSAGAKPIFIGGDHSQAAGAWRGVGRALGSAPGLIWIDAHLDSHTPATSLSGNLHGMPLAALLGYGDPAMTDIPGPTLDPRRVAVIGVHSFEAAELEFLNDLGVRIFNLAEIRSQGLDSVFSEALRIAGGGGSGFGISFDIDAIDPVEAPGVSTPVAGGLQAETLRQALHSCLRDGACVGLEIVEYCPDSDPQGRTARLVLDLVDSASQPGSAELRQWEGKHGARNYAPLPVVLHSGSGCWLTDVEDRRYLDLLEKKELTSHAAELGEHLLVSLQRIARNSPRVREVCCCSLLAGIELNPQTDAHSLALAFMRRGLLTRETLAAWGKPLPWAA